MQSIKYGLKRLGKLNDLLETRCTGSAAQTAKKFNVSERTFRNHKNSVNELMASNGIPVEIIYDRDLLTYRFSKRGKIVVDIRFEYISE